MKLTYANKIRDYVKEKINPYGKPFEGSVYEFGLKIMHYIDNMSADYDLDNVIEALESYRNEITCDIDIDNAIEIVKKGCVSEDVCEWKLEDEEANLYLTGCQQRQLIFDGTPKENGYRYCPYCGKKIKVV